MAVNTNRILALDAGGIKGGYSSLVIGQLQLKFGLNSNSHFHYYTGTSIGAVIATLLADGIPADKILQKFNELRNELHRGYLVLGQLLFEWLDEIFGNRMMHSIPKKLFIPVFNLTEKKHAFACNYETTVDYPIMAVLRAACADLRMMPPQPLDETGVEYADAGFFAYDPTLFFLRSNKMLLTTPVSIISIGSGIIANAMDELNKSDIFDTLYDSFLDEQFLTTRFFFETHTQINYLRISEFPTKAYAEFPYENLESIVDQRIAGLETEIRRFI